MKDTYYFQHDYNARNDPKLQEVLIEHGAMGLGVFWCIVEQLYEQGGRLPLRSCKSIAFSLHVEGTVVESIVHDFDLFEADDPAFWSRSVLARMDKRKEISERRKKAAQARWKSAKIKQKHHKSPPTGKTVSAKVKDAGEKAPARFSPPTLNDVKNYAEEKGYTLFDAERFIDFYTAKGWMIGKNKMKDWKAAVRNWSKSDKPRSKNQPSNNINDEWK